MSEERFGDGEVIGSGDTAAHIIWQAAQDYRINPQVLIVLLQKETSLITDPIPNNGDYRKATGFEALIGYLYLTGRQQRVVEIAKCAIEYLDREES